jgi:signal transduction histidine kinase
MSALPPATGPHSSLGGPAGDSAFEESTWERRSRRRSPSARWIGWRLRALVLAALAGCIAMFLLLRALAMVPALEARLRVDDAGVLRIVGPTPAPALQSLIGVDGQAHPIDALLVQRSARWLAHDDDRASQARQHDLLAAALANGSVRFVDAEGQTHRVEAMPRGAAGMGWLYWLLSTFALLLYQVTMVVLLARPEPRNALFATMAFAQVGNLLFLAALSTPALGWPAGFMRWELGLRTGFDLITAAALVHVTNLHPRRLDGGGLRSAMAWLAAAIALTTVSAGVLPYGWWWTQGLAIAGALMAIAQLAWMQRRDPHPLALQLLRFCTVAVATLVLLTATVAALGPGLQARGQAAAIGSAVWVVFLAAMLLLLPFLSRTQQLMREFSLVAGVSTVATALDLLFVAVFSLGNFASLTLALFISLAVYAGARQWLLAQVMSRQRLTTERMFEHLYRVAREVQIEPRSVGDQLGRLLRELFEPLSVQYAARRTRRSRVVGEGANLVVPVPRLEDWSGVAAEPHGALVLGFAERGRRLFTEDDARLADRIVDLIARAVAFDQAVERGRSEERVRIAQDLHDDIGARLLTLMYQAPTPEMEDYLRHTLKDLKTLTRGLAAPSHPLSHAIAEWKADIGQRAAAADCELGWAFAYDRDFQLSVVQWSALTRVLRELVSNALAHAHATRIDVEASIGDGALVLAVIDNGSGRAPQTWSHGLGLGGVRKRVKQLGGEVVWLENGERGIACRVSVPGFGPAR